MLKKTLTLITLLVIVGNLNAKLPGGVKAKMLELSTDELGLWKFTLRLTDPIFKNNTMKWGYVTTALNSEDFDTKKVSTLYPEFKKAVLDKSEEWVFATNRAPRKRTYGIRQIIEVEVDVILRNTEKLKEPIDRKNPVKENVVLNRRKMKLLDKVRNVELYEMPGQYPYESIIELEKKKLQQEKIEQDRITRQEKEKAEKQSLEQNGWDWSALEFQKKAPVLPDEETEEEKAKKERLEKIEIENKKREKEILKFIEATGGIERLLTNSFWDEISKKLSKNEIKMTFYIKELSQMELMLLPMESIINAASGINAIASSGDKKIVIEYKTDLDPTQSDFNGLGMANSIARKMGNIPFPNSPFTFKEIFNTIGVGKMEIIFIGPVGQFKKEGVGF